MSDHQRTLERELERLSPPRILFDQLVQRRDRKRRDQRIRAGVLGLVIAIGIVAGALSIGAIRSTSLIPVEDPTPTRAELGIFADVRGWIAYGDPLGHEPLGIWAMDPANPDSDPVLLDPDEGVPTAWSSDGSKLLVLRLHDSGRPSNSMSLVVLNADGTETHLAAASEITGGSFTPDGSKVVYGATLPGEEWKSGIYVVDADGGSPRLVYVAGRRPEPDAFQMEVTFPALSPDGSRIAYFEGMHDWGTSLWVMNADGTERHQIVGEDEGIAHVGGIQWSPDGTRLSFLRPGSIYVVDADGSDLALVADGVTDRWPILEPYWSPDGTRLAFTTGREKLASLATVRPDGTQLQDYGVGRAGPWNPLAPEGVDTATSTPSVPVEDATPIPTVTEPRRDGEFIVFEPSGTGPGWDLAAQDPETGEVRTIVETDGIVDCEGGAPCTNFIRKAEWSADGRWVAFEISNASLDGPALGPCAPKVGIWVQPADGEPRQLTTPCDAPPLGSHEPVRELWAWSPVDARLAYVRIDGRTDELLVIDPEGTSTSLVTGNVDPPYPVESSSLAWSPDGSQIAYVDGSSVYAVNVDGGERSLLADSFEDIIDIAWSPAGTHILVQDQTRYRIQVMNADGSDLHVLLQGEDACCDMAWSPKGDRILYLLSGVDAGKRPWLNGQMGHSEVWTVAPDGSNPVEIFGEDSCVDGNIDGAPAWDPDGSQVAYNAPGCGGWLVEYADGTGDVRPIDELLWRSWYGGGLTGSDLAAIGQIDH